MDTYILQVKLPDGSMPGDEYKCESVSIFYYNNTRPDSVYISKNHVENNPTFFKKKEPSPEILKIYSDNKYIIEYHEGESENYSKLDAREGSEIFEDALDFRNTPRKFTQQDIDNAHMEGFISARTTHDSNELKYPKYQDYLNSINRKKYP